MNIKKLRPLDNVRRSVIPGLDGPAKKNEAGQEIPDAAVDRQREIYAAIAELPVGELITIDNEATAGWLVQFGWFVEVKGE